MRIIFCFKLFKFKFVNIVGNEKDNHKNKSKKEKKIELKHYINLQELIFLL